MTHSSRPVSSLVAIMITWIAMAPSVMKSFGASAASSGYQSRTATIMTSSDAPNRHAHACLSRNTPTSTRRRARALRRRIRQEPVRRDIDPPLEARGLPHPSTLADSRGSPLRDTPARCRSPGR